MKILLVPDVPNWAFDLDANAMIDFLPDYNIDKVYKNQLNVDLIKKYDLVHVMNWYDAMHLSDGVSAGVCSHNFELLHSERSRKIFPKYKALVATSMFIYEKIKNQNDNVFYAPKGVREDLFKPIKKVCNKKFVVGFVAQNTIGKIDIKGYQSVLVPLIQRLNRKDVEFKLLSNTYKNAIDHSKMPLFYHGIDCLICTSFMEGGPNPIFEAASCGMAVISTCVGVVPDFVRHGYNGYLVNSYDINDKDTIIGTINSFEKYILRLKDNRDICDEMGERNRQLIEESWTWKERAKDWISVFEKFKK